MVFKDHCKGLYGINPVFQEHFGSVRPLVKERAVGWHFDELTDIDSAAVYNHRITADVQNTVGLVFQKQLGLEVGAVGYLLDVEVGVAYGDVFVLVQQVRVF